ncbi:MAG TPA: PAS domain S-box protein [Polyangiaceae bacterium]|nr:PAS domain S-box protein [Polyangiaceae bacterium]
MLFRAQSTRIKRFAKILLTVQAVMVVVLGFSTFLLERQFERLNQSRDVAFRSYLLADELRQSDDDLTLLARSFVVTGEPDYERQYWTVLNVRSGKLPRPAGYKGLDWNLVAARNSRLHPVGKAEPLRQLMIDEGFTQAELSKLDRALQYSDGLVRTESTAMNAAKGLFADVTGHFTLQQAPDRELAIRLLHDEAYAEAKRSVIQPIDEFFAMFQARTAAAVAESLADSRTRLRWLSGILLATLVLFVGSLAALLRQSAEREAAQRALADSEARYRTIFQTAADGFGLVDKHARILEVNDALCRMSGYSAAELRAMKVSDLEESENETELAGHLEHAREHQDKRFSARLKHRDGGTFDVEVSAQYRPLDSGRFVIVMRDVTELRRAQAAQRESEQMLLNAFLANPAAIWISEGNDAKACVAINDAFEAATGFTREDVIGKTGDGISFYEHPRDRERLLEELRRSGKVHNAELRFRKKDGELRDGVFNLQVSRVGDKAYVLVVLTDATEAKRAQRELERLLRVETLMANLAASFVDAQDEALDPVVNQAITQICEEFSLDMAAVWQPDPLSAASVRTHLVVMGAPTTVPVPAAGTEFPWLFELSKTNKTTIVTDVNAALPAHACIDRERLRAAGVTNLVMIPWCTTPGSLDGVISFASTRGRQLDALAVSQLETLSRTILVVLSRARERRAASEARERMRTQLEMLDDAPAGISINEGVNFLYANKQAAAMHGYTVEEFAGQTVATLVAPEERCRLDDLRRTFAEHGSHAFTIWHRRKDGTPLHLSVEVRRSRWLGQEVLISVFVDLSEREKAAAALRESEERYRLVAENVSDVISVLNLETERYEYVSPSVFRLTGYTAEEATQQTLSSTLTAGSLELARRRVARLLEAERAGQDVANANHDVVVYEEVRKDGSVVPIEVRARLLRDPTNSKPLLLSVARDISERQRSEQEREELQQQLYQSQKLEAIGGLAGGVAHDFNNLLSVIMSYTDFVVDKLPDDDARRSDLQEVQKASTRAIGLVRQLLAFSRKQILEPRMIDLNQVVSGIENMLRRLLGEDIQLEVVLAENLGTVLADAGQVEQVLMNLVVNARDAMPRGGSLIIETSNVVVAETKGSLPPGKLKPGRYASFSVADSGAGMDEATLARAFEPFFTTKGPGKGTGLGLSTVYGIVKQSEGEVQVRSKPGVGTAFSVYLPRQDARLSIVPAQRVTASDTGRETVLVVEDEHGLRALVQRILVNAGYTVLVAENGADALALFDQREGKVDLLLTDVVMPQMSGYQLAERLARSKPTLKVLYMSGYTDEIIDRHGVLKDGVRLIGKPFTAADMSRKVRVVLDENSGAVA